MAIGAKDIPGLLYKQLTNRKVREPQNPLSVATFNKESFLSEESKGKFIWYGHSVLLMRLMGMTILIDPMLGSDASPIAPFKTKRFAENTLNLIDDFPEIDLLLISHDHYDHLDYDSIQKLKAKTKKYYVALGVKRHLVSWGVDAELISEFDWWDELNFEGVQITFTPTRHFSGRGITDRAKSLWGGWVFKTTEENIWFSGDGGYGEHFKEVGERLGPFDFGFMECGQYNELWRQIHLFPDESVQAAIDAGVKKAMPVHWCGFALAMHPWEEPANDFEAHAKQLGLNISYPRLGQQFSTSESINIKWWQEF